jgi:hypothetical protein
MRKPFALGFNRNLVESTDRIKRVWSPGHCTVQYRFGGHWHEVLPSQRDPKDEFPILAGIHNERMRLGIPR